MKPKINSQAVGVRYCLRCRYGRYAVTLEFYSLFSSKLIFALDTSKIFRVRKFSVSKKISINSDLKSKCKNEFKDNNEKSCS